MKVLVLSFLLIVAASSAPLLRSGLDSAYFGSVQVFPSFSTQSSYSTYLTHGAQPVAYQFPTQYYQPSPITYYTPTYFGAHQYQFIGSPFLDSPSVFPVHQSPVIPHPVYPQVSPVPPVGVPQIPQVETEPDQSNPAELEPQPQPQPEQEIANDAVENDDDTVTIDSA